jgi:hypothetical protein
MDQVVRLTATKHTARRGQLYSSNILKLNFFFHDAFTTLFVIKVTTIKAVES